MAREHPDYRDNLELLNRRFPDHDILTTEEIMQVTGYKCPKTVLLKFKDAFVAPGKISKVKMARWLCGLKM